MKEIKLQDYQNALKIWSSYCDDEPHPYSFPKYIEEIIDELEEQKLKTVLLSDTQKPVSPWRTDIENAPRRTILILDNQNDPFLVYPDDYAHDTWGTSVFDDEIFQNSEIAYWMPIPELPTI